MSKLYRSLLWSGVVAAGVAACGDDVTVTPPPPATAVHSVSVGPSGITIAAGTSLQMVASVNADPGVATTVTWSINVPATVASISATGNLTTIAGQTGNIAVQACSTVNASVCGNATVIVALTAPGSPTVTQINVSPATPILFKPVGAATSTVQLSAAVIGTNSPSQTVTWSVVGAPTGASVSNTGLVTITSAITVGSFNVSACSQVAGFTNICGFSTVTISTAIPATISGQTNSYVPAAGAPTNCTPTGAGLVPLVLTNVNCQIEVSATVNAGDIVLARMDVVMTNTCTVPPNTAANCSAAGNSRVMASHTFPGTVANQGGDEANVSAPSTISLSIDTRMVRSPSNSASNLVPAIFNGNATIQLILYTPTGQQVAASTPTPVVMNNADAVTYPTSLVNTTNTPVGGFTVAGVTFFTGTQTIAGARYISYSQTVPATSGFGGTLCGTSSSVVAGTPTTGITLGGLFACAGVEGSNTVVATVPAFTYAVATGPDGTPITPPTFYSTVGSAFQMPISPPPTATTESRWNLLVQCGPVVPLTCPGGVPLPTLLPTVGVDNKAPTVGAPVVAFNDLFDFPWINASYLFAQDLVASDAGSGLAPTVLQARDYLAGVFVPASAGCSALVVTSGADYAETLTSAGGWRICTFATDNVGNTASSGPSNFFGVDKVVPLVRLIFATPPGVNPVGIYTSPSVSSTPNTSRYQTVAALLNMPWGLEGVDTRSGFNQFVVPGDDAAHQALTRLWPGAVSNTGDSACTLSDQMLTLLSDGWRRTGLPAPGQDQLDCGAGVGYYFYTGWDLDRAGNQSTQIIRNFVFDPGTPNMTGIGFFAPYTPGNTAPFSFSANDDLNIVSATIGFAMNGMPFPAVGIQYPQCCLFSQPPGPFFGITLGAGWGTLWPTTKTQLASSLNGAVANVDNFIFRTDESCRFNGDPYSSCNVALNGTGSKPTVAADYNQNLYGGGVLTNQQKLPSAVLANVADAVGRETTTGIVAQMLNTQFNPSTGIAAPWGGAGCLPLSSTCADIANWTASVVGTSAVAVHKTQTSNGLTYFDDVSLWRFNTTVNQWNYCERAVNPTVPTIDNGSFRTWTYTVLLPTAPSPCFQLTGQFKVMGRKGGAGLFTVAFP